MERCRILKKPNALRSVYCIYGKKLELRNEIAGILLKFSHDVYIGAKKYRLDGTFKNCLLLVPCLLQAEAEQEQVTIPHRGEPHGLH